MLTIKKFIKKKNKIKYSVIDSLIIVTLTHLSRLLIAVSFCSELFPPTMIKVNWYLKIVEFWNLVIVLHVKVFVCESWRVCICLFAWSCQTRTIISFLGLITSQTKKNTFTLYSNYRFVCIFYFNMSHKICWREKKFS